MKVWELIKFLHKSPSDYDVVLHDWVEQTSVPFVFAEDEISIDGSDIILGRPKEYERRNQ